MVLVAFLIAIAGALVALALFSGAQAAAREHGRENLANELGSMLDDAKATDATHGSGTFEGMPVTVEVGEHAVLFTAQLPPAIVPYAELLGRHGSVGLKRRLAELSLTVSATDLVSGALPREAGLDENLVSVSKRFPTVAALRDLRRFAPGELLTRIERAHSTAEIDGLLLELTKYFPEAPETQDAIDLAAERASSSPERVRERAQRWLTRPTTSS